jgi:D-alanyl-D-alanine carboxypeptidase
MVKGNKVIQPEKLERALALIDRYIERRMKNGLGPGVALALTDRRQTLTVRTYGLADIASQRPITPDTLFEIGSISKAFVAAALLRQHEAGRLDLHAPVTQYLDWFEVQSEFEPITIHHLLSHTGGIVTGTSTAPSSRYIVWNLRNTRTGFPPGEHFHYSNTGYQALGYVLENLTELPYAEAMRTQVLEPLGLSASEPTITHNIRERMAFGYRHSHSDDRPTPPKVTFSPTTWFEFDGAPGSVACTPADLVAFLRMLLNRGQGERGPFLSEESFGLMTQEIVESDWDGLTHGYGLFFKEREEFDGHFIVQNGGEMIGYETTMMGDMDDGVGVVVLVNSFHVPWEETHFALKVLQALVNDRDLPPLPSPQESDASANDTAAYIGTYRSADKTFELIERDEHMVMLYGNEHITLEQRFPGAFYAPHPDFELSLLKFGRAEDVVVEAFHGADWYRNERYDGAADFDYPAEWDAYVGHYRTHSPWMSNFRFFVRKGRPYLQWWGMFEQPLTALDDGDFRIGEAEYSPERLRFDCFAEGQALRANLSGGDYYRVEMP